MASGYLTNLAAVAARTGFPVKKVSGWKNRGHGGFRGVHTVVCHHTAGPSSGEMPSLGVVTYGRAGLPGPLCNYGLGRSGTIYVVAAGVAWHAGVVRHYTYGNSYSIGIEAEEDGVSGWADVQIRAYAALCRALIDEFDLGVGRVLGHKEVCSPPGRKIDPNFSMPNFRQRVKTASRRTEPTGDPDAMIHSSYSHNKNQPLPWGKWSMVLWDTDNSGDKRNNTPGHVAPRKGWTAVELADLKLSGLTQDDSFKTRLVVYKTKPYKRLFAEMAGDRSATGGADWVTAHKWKWLTKGQHIAWQIKPVPGDGDTSRTQPVARSGRFTAHQEEG